MMEQPWMPTTTMMFILATVIMWLAYEAYVIYYKKETISEAMHKISHVHPMVLIIIGILLGHFFW